MAYISLALMIGAMRMNLSFFAFYATTAMIVNSAWQREVTPRPQGRPPGRRRKTV